MIGNITFKFCNYVIAPALFGILSWTALEGQQPQGPLHTLIVGGGPDKSHNQVAIESNVRYLGRTLPSSAFLHVLFTDGNPQSENVQCQGDDQKIYYRTPQLPRLDGPSKSANVRSEIETLAREITAHPSGAAFLYFTGHGSPNPNSAYNNNEYDLWDKDSFSVKDLSASLRSFPKSTPIVLVMVQCFSGAFGNVLFEDGNPEGALVERHICGFFASVPQRPAAGCTPEINEANYRDFTSYFLAALSGTDRLGHTVSGADYNHDGKVGMDEAFAYSLIHDDSIDTPVCTSDTFLRRFVKRQDPEIFRTAIFPQVRSWARPPQLAALDGLSKMLGFSGDDQLGVAYHEFQTTDVQSEELRASRLIRFVRLAKSIILGHSLATGSDRALKGRYAELLKEESSNPLTVTRSPKSASLSADCTSCK